MQETERLHGALVSALKASHSQELLNYEQDVYLLQSKVKSAGLAGGGDADARVEHLNKQVAELETLISGELQSVTINITKFVNHTPNLWRFNANSMVNLLSPG